MVLNGENGGGVFDFVPATPCCMLLLRACGSSVDGRVMTGGEEIEFNS